MQTKAKVIVAFYSLAFIALGAVVIAMAVGWSQGIYQVNAALADPAGRWVAGLLGSLVIIIALIILFISMKTSVPTEAGVVQELNLGRVVTTVTAIESVVRKAVRQVRGVREVQPRINYSSEGLVINLSIVLSPDVKVLEVTPQIQDNVKQQIFEIIGVDVLEVKIRVENIGYDVRSRVE